jgi:hypothetical protein
MLDATQIIDRPAHLPTDHPPVAKRKIGILPIWERQMRRTIGPCDAI